MMGSGARKASAESRRMVQAGGSARSLLLPELRGRSAVARDGQPRKRQTEGRGKRLNQGGTARQCAPVLDIRPAGAFFRPGGQDA